MASAVNKARKEKIICWDAIWSLRLAVVLSLALIGWGFVRLVQLGPPTAVPEEMMARQQDMRRGIILLSIGVAFMPVYLLAKKIGGEWH